MLTIEISVRYVKYDSLCRVKSEASSRGQVAVQVYCGLVEELDRKSVQCECSFIEHS